MYLKTIISDADILSHTLTQQFVFLPIALVNWRNKTHPYQRTL